MAIFDPSYDVKPKLVIFHTPAFRENNTTYHEKCSEDHTIPRLQIYVDFILTVNEGDSTHYLLPELDHFQNIVGQELLQFSLPC